MDLRPDITVPFKIFGAAATVTPLAGAPVATRVIVSHVSDTLAAGTELAIRSYHRTVDVQRAAVPSLPKGSTIVVSEGLDAGSYVIDLVVGQTAEVHRAIARAA